ncbi:MAG: hypothetical protein V3U29_08310, partial [Phycisphaeraceae bacterium]
MDGEDLHAGVTEVGDVHTSIFIDGDVVGSVEFAVRSTELAPRALVFAVQGKYLDAMIELVGNVDAAVAAHGDTDCHVELSGTA